MLASRRRRTLLSGAGIVLAAAMLAAAVVIADGLGGGFSRAARRADLGDLIVRFSPQPASRVARRIAALPDLSGFALRSEVTSVPVRFRTHSARTAVAEVLGPGHRQGIAVVAGRGLRGAGPEVLVEPAWAAAWGMHVGSELRLPGLGPERVVGLAEGPDDVGYPLGAPRFYLSRAQIVRRFGPEPDPQVNFAEVWLRDPRYVSEVLVQARDESFGLRGLQFATRSGVQVLISQAAGLVIDLLVALSGIALVTAGVMLGASARAEVQRRLRAIGVRRALGATRGQVAATQAVEAALVAVPAASVGTLAGWAATNGPGDRLLGLLNQPGPGAGLIPWLLAGWALSVVVPVLGAAWPAWSAAGATILSLLRGADVAAGPGRSAGRSTVGSGGPAAGWVGGLVWLGVRLAAARRARLAVTVTMLASSTAFVLLMIALAGALSSLETDPQELGKRYQLSVAASPSAAARIARLPGVAAAAPRYDVHAVDGYDLGELIDVIAYPGDHTRFEAPPLDAGRRLRGTGEAEVGVGLADALGLAPGSRLLMELPSGRQLSLRVAGTVSSLAYQGLVAYVPAAALLEADPSAPSSVAVLLSPGADPNRVQAEMRAAGIQSTAAAGPVARGAPLVAVLKTILRAVAVVDGLVCIYALMQACALTVSERRRTVAVLRATGANAAAIGRLLGGAVLTLLVPAALIGVLLEWLALGPLLSHLAAGYASLDLRPTPAEVGGVLGGLALAGCVAVLWVSVSAVRASIVEGLAP
ncbi:MAG TPA: FtsX-like permease family protein [Solirubrobacteraceae bacterium]|nr:FtsX-like permease family protein [Solirubrobacteraceae bacterium]